MISSMLLDYLKEQNKIPIDILEQRIDICDSCEHCNHRHCSLLGCSAWRFKEVLLSESPRCPEGKH